MTLSVQAMLREAEPHAMRPGSFDLPRQPGVGEKRVGGLSRPLMRLYRLLGRALGRNPRRLVIQQDRIHALRKDGEVGALGKKCNKSGLDGLNATEHARGHFQVGFQRHAFVCELRVWRFVVHLSFSFEKDAAEAAE